MGEITDETQISPRQRNNDDEGSHPPFLKGLAAALPSL
jgi:hypothetical protein